MLDMIEGDEGERVRWLFGLRAIDSLLADFLYPMEEKYELVTRLREKFRCGVRDEPRIKKSNLEKKLPEKNRAVIK